MACRSGLLRLESLDWSARRPHQCLPRGRLDEPVLKHDLAPEVPDVEPHQPIERASSGMPRARYYALLREGGRRNIVRFTVALSVARSSIGLRRVGTQSRVFQRSNPPGTSIPRGHCAPGP